MTGTNVQTTPTHFVLFWEQRRFAFEGLSNGVVLACKGGYQEAWEGKIQFHLDRYIENVDIRFPSELTSFYF